MKRCQIIYLQNIKKIYKYRKKVIDVTQNKNIDISNMNRNLEKLCIKEKHKLQNDSVAGTYSTLQNKIYIKNKEEQSVLFHEFMHMCSSHKENKLELKWISYN